MAVLALSEITDILLDRLQANVSVDGAFTAAEILRHVNEAYSDIWNASGGGLTGAQSTSVWSGTPGTGGIFIGQSAISDLEELLHVWALPAAGGDLAGGAVGDVELRPVDLSKIYYLRTTPATSFGIYATPKVYALTRRRATTDATVNRFQLDVWPSGAGSFYFPIQYVPQFIPLAGAVTVPDVNDLESRDIALLAASRMAPLVGRAEFVPSIISDVSERTQRALERKFEGSMSGKQDK